MEYQKILSDLKRYSFNEKMRMAHKYSKHLITPIGVTDVEIMRKMPLPWNLETFVLMAVRAGEWKFDDFRGKREQTFINMINCIAAYIHPVLNQYRGTAFGEYFQRAEFPLQFDIQEFYPYKFYRYNVYFNYPNDRINMKEVFRNFFGCDYYEFLIVIQFLWLLFSSDHIPPQSLIPNLMAKYPVVFQNLSITREHYIEELDSITKEVPDYKYCIRPSYSFPFISDKQVLYLPLPHLLIRSVTSSLLYRLTDENDELAAIIGKEIFEPYLLDIIKRNELFDEVFAEKTYRVRRLEQRTLDVMARKDDYYVFLIVNPTRQKEI